MLPNGSCLHLAHPLACVEMFADRYHRLHRDHLFNLLNVLDGNTTADMLEPPRETCDP